MYHFIGIGGIGMSALARILLDKKAAVAGSDRREGAAVSALMERGAVVDLQQGGEKLSSDTKVIYSSAIKPSNKEFVRAQELGCTLLHRSDLLQELTQGYKSLAVAGTHGKTTISSMLTHVLIEAGLDPAFAIGGTLPNLKINGRHGDGPYFVLEADESDGTFVAYHPHAAILTNVEAEHLDTYGSVEKMHAAYATFIDQCERLVWCGDDPYLQTLKPKGIAYGFSEGCDVRATNLVQEGFSTTFEVGGERITLPVAGHHNALNALGVYALCKELGIDSKGLGTYPGVGRRLEKKSAYLFDDYAHHPTEVRASLQALRSAIGNKRLIACFQPHRYSRLQVCLDDFSFEEADELFITEVYSAGEEPIPGIDSKALVERVGGEFVPKEKLVEKLKATLGPGDIVIMMGAGDITALSTADLRLKVGVLCGGDPSEHEVSLMSADFFLNNLDRELYDVRKIVMDRAPPVDALKACDLVIPVLHGPRGEDGIVAGLLDALDIPYVGCDHRAGAICMDKALTKIVVAAHGIATPPFVDLRRDTWDGSVPDIDLPVYVKPCHLGSTVGVTRVDRAEDLIPTIEHVFTLDDRLIVEKAVDKRDIEFGILGDNVAGPSEVLIGNDLYTYEGKYVPPGAPACHHPDLPEEVIEEGRRLARKVFDVLGCRGLARIDFFLDQDNKYWLNEVNPMPGCTPLSMYPRMWQAAGIEPATLVDTLVSNALTAHAR